MAEQPSKTIRAGSRSSRLALLQVEEIESLLKAQGMTAAFEKVRFETKGDRDKTTPLAQSADDFFTDVLDQALLDGKIDIAIHSAKDLPQNLHPGLKIFVLTQGVDDADAFVGKMSFGQLKPGSKVGTSSMIRQNNIKELRPDVIAVDIRGTIEERLKLMDDGQCDGIIVAAAALKRLGSAHLIKDIMPWDAAPLQGQLAVVGRVGDVSLQEFFRPMDVRRTYGKVVLVGAGPGDPELITVKAQKALAQADCVFYDYLVDVTLLEYAPKAEHVFVGKRKGLHSLPQAQLNRMLKDKAVAGKNIVRLKGGDPFIFGRGADELEYLMAHHICVEIIPGVSSATAVPSILGIPLTARASSSSVAFVSGHMESECGPDPQPIEIPDTQTVVFLMGLTKLNQIVEGLIRKGWPPQTPIVVISRGTTVEEQALYATISTIREAVKDQKLSPPALIVAGETVRFFESFRKHKQLTLFTGLAPEKYRVFEPMLHVPTIEIAPVDLNPAAVESLKVDVTAADGLIITSVCGSRSFRQLLDHHGISVEDVLKKTICVIGPGTAKAAAQDFRRPDIIASVESSEGFLEALFAAMDVRGKRFLFPRSNLSNPTIKTEIERRGGRVDEWTVYENRKPLKQKFSAALIRQVIFTSPSTARNYLDDYGPIPKDWTILARGPLTQKELEKAGYQSLQLT